VDVKPAAGRCILALPRRARRLIVGKEDPVRTTLSLALSMALLPAAASAQRTVAATGGDITITPIQHATLQIEHAGTVIAIDPAQGDLSKAKPADLVLVTDIHGDHLNPEGIGKARKAGAPVVMPAAAREKAGDTVPAPVETLANGERKTVAGVQVEAVPMYNLQRGPQPGQLFHTKGRGNGYVVTLGGKRVYFAGDTECVPEIRALQNIDVAFVPMNLPYTMPPSEAAQCVKAFKPKVVYPYHFRGQDPKEFEKALAGSGVDVRILDWYPSAPPGGQP
jgi:L-ascorbate metabolism protein UlaG (beta-lactamase superfamily)